MVKNNFENVNSIKGYAATGIVIMHVLENGQYALNGVVFERVIPSFTNFVYLFMILSSFLMCCGYYEKVIKNSISIEDFYLRRYKKIWPFFALLTCVDFVVSPSTESFYESFANLTLVFGLLPNANISVIGVGWTLGVIFVFYMLFPFFCFLLKNEKRAWVTLIITILFNAICEKYFFDDTHVIESFSSRTNILFCAMFFMAGGLLYLYKEDIISLFAKNIIFRIITIFCAILIFVTSTNLYLQFISFNLVVIYSIISDKNIVLNNPVINCISSYSFEIYLCHMLIYRVLEKIGLTHIVLNEMISYIVTVLMTMAGTLTVSIAYKIVINRITYKRKTFNLWGKN